MCNIWGLVFSWHGCVFCMFYMPVCRQYVCFLFAEKSQHCRFQFSRQLWLWQRWCKSKQIIVEIVKNKQTGYHVKYCLSCIHCLIISMLWSPVIHSFFLTTLWLGFSTRTVLYNHIYVLTHKYTNNWYIEKWPLNGYFSIYSTVDSTHFCGGKTNLCVCAHLKAFIPKTVWLWMLSWTTCEASQVFFVNIWMVKWFTPGTPVCPTGGTGLAQNE